MAGLAKLKGGELWIRKNLRNQRRHRRRERARLKPKGSPASEFGEAVIRMNSDEVWARCQSCGTELKESDKVCPKCGSTKKAFHREASVAVSVKIVEARARQKGQGFKKFMKEIISRWCPSRNSELKDGVNEERIIDKEKNEYHQTVKDARTGEIIHEEHKPLSQHKHLGSSA